MSQDDIYFFALPVPGDLCLFHFYLVMALCFPPIMDPRHSVEHIPGEIQIELLIKIQWTVASTRLYYSDPFYSCYLLTC